MAKILVTGGAGFIGSHLVKNLVELGHKVVVVDILLRGNKIDSEIMKTIEFHKIDVKSREDILRVSEGCDYIYHFAAVLGVDVVADNPVETMDTEILGMQNIVEAHMTHGIKKLIYASTSGIYGHSAISDSVVENVIVDPRTSYAIAKRYNEIYLGAQYEEKGLKSVSLRFFNVYGQGQDNRMVVPRFFEQAKANRPITVYGTGEQTRDFTYIDDTIKACIELMKKVDGCEIFNVANESEYSIGDLATLIKEMTNSESEIKFIEAPKKRYDYEVERRIGNSAKLFNAIGYKPTTTLREGLNNII